jgi:hypothetical protein
LETNDLSQLILVINSPMKHANCRWFLCQSGWWNSFRCQARIRISVLLL